MKSEVYNGKVNTRDELVVRIMNSAALIKQERQAIQSPDRPARSESLYRLSCPGPQYFFYDGSRYLWIFNIDLASCYPSGG
jgi:hypothetical protein